MQAARTKIVATLGPATDDPALVRRLIATGVDVFRLNFSHDTCEGHGRRIRTVREAAAEAHEPVAILQDLQGPRIRTGRLEGGGPVQLAEGAEVTLRHGDFRGDAAHIPVSYELLASEVAVRDRIMLSDGRIELEVVATDGTQARCKVVVGGPLGERQGINLPGVALSITAPTPKDIEDLHFGMDQGVDFVALSFVRSADDVVRLKQAMRDYGGEGSELPVIAKIEKPEAVQHLWDILQVSDGVMVARGDLGIEMATEAVPGVQKAILQAANRAGVPAITATQMLESMVKNPRPTRAEASDVANAILDGTDAVMLSAETSIGEYPAEAVHMMDAIARAIEGQVRRPGGANAPEAEEAGSPTAHALANAACLIAERLDAACIAPFTITGTTARYISQRRPGTPIFALTPHERTARRLMLLWGVFPVLLDMFETTDEMVEHGRARLLRLGLVSPGDTVVYVAGPSTGTAGGTDMLKVETIPTAR